jgi:hypothetical protein
MTPEVGSSRVADAEYVMRAQCVITELLGGECAELILHPECPVLGATHDHVEAAAFARVAVASPTAVDALLAYCEAEARGLLLANLAVLHALVAALIERGTLVSDEIDTIIHAAISAETLASEKVHRRDWQLRQTSAARFVAD